MSHSSKTAVNHSNDVTFYWKVRLNLHSNLKGNLYQIKLAFSSRKFLFITFKFLMHWNFVRPEWRNHLKCKKLRRYETCFLDFLRRGNLNETSKSFQVEKINRESANHHSRKTPQHTVLYWKRHLFNWWSSCNGQHEF